MRLTLFAASPSFRRGLLAALFLFAALPGRAVMVDLNGDGASDIWALKYGVTLLSPTADADGDGIKDAAEATAGTDPFSAGSTIKISSIVLDGAGLHITFPTLLGKGYLLQKSASLVAPSWVTANPLTPGTGGALTLNLPAAGATQYFYRVAVQDVDSDGDGVNDWEEITLGFDPNNPKTHGSASPGDLAEITTALQSPNVVTIAATDPAASETGLDPGTFTVTRSGGLNAITVPLTVGGTAQAGVDYVALPSSVTLGLGVNTVTLNVTPIADAVLEGTESVVVSLATGAGFSLAAVKGATVLISDAGVANGDGLRAQFYNETGALANTVPPTWSALAVPTRVDAVVDYDWDSSTTQGVGSPAVGVNTNYFACRWSGEVLPEFSEVYTFQITVNLAGRLWVNGELIINNWTDTPTTGAVSATYEGTVALEAGRRYAIVFEQFDTTGTASAHLRWKSLTQPLQAIPQARLFSATSSAVTRPHITSPLEAAAYVGGPAFSYQITATGNPTAFSAANLPPGLSVDAAGLISGTATQPGIWQVAIGASNVAGGDSAILALTCSAGGTITRDVWTGLAGTSIDTIPLYTAPTTTGTVTALEVAQSAPDSNDFGQRLRGFITAPTTGAYQFWLAGDATAELLISDDTDEFKAIRRASLLTATGFRDWANAAKSLPIWLQGGQRYYLEVRHKESSGADHVSVGWLKPGQTGTAPSEVVPGYVLSGYIAPATAPFDGTFYSTNLLAQTGVVTSATGSATLQLNAAETQAILSFNYAGLTSAKTGEHIHSGAHGGSIIFDIDTVPQNPDGSYTWNIVGVGAITAQDIVNVIKNGDAYLNIHTANNPSGEIKGYFKLQAASQVFVPPAAVAPAADDHTDAKAAARFLQQATFGPSAAGLAELQGKASYDQWITDEFAKAATLHLPSILNGGGANPSDFYPGSLSFNTWWQRSVTANDQLRQRVAFALGEILVASETGPLDERARALSHYYDTLLTYAFGNFRDVLEAITLTPGMGLYLDMRKNDKPDTTIGRIPNENYAREIMQLFSIGLNRLHPDGTLKLDVKNGVIPTYTQDEIVGLAHVFTGWNYNQPMNGALFSTSWSPSTVETAPMTEVPTHHFTGPKRVLNRTYLAGLTSAAGQRLDPWLYTHPSGQTTDAAYQALPAQELDATHDMLFNHPNTGPFICRQLIQRLVTSTPSRGYLYRVVQKFENNGSGVRGELQAVIRAILTDFEARSATMITRETFGKQREPVLRVTGLARAFPAPAPVAGTYAQTGNLITLTISNTNITSAGPAFLDFSAGAEGDPKDQSYALAPVAGSNPPQFTIRPIGTLSGSYNQVANDSFITVDFGTTQHGLSTGALVYLDFNSVTTGTQPGDGFHAVTVTTSTAFTIFAPDTTARSGGSSSVASTRASDTYGAQAGATFSQPANSATVTVTTATNHNVPDGTTLFLDFSSGTPDGSYVATVTSPTTFTVTAATSTSARSGTVTFAWNGADISRTGNVTVDFASYGVGNTDTDLGQTPLNSPTVFNYFQPDYAFPGTLAQAQMVTPEFQLTSETNVIRQAQYLFNGIRGTSSSSSNLNSSGASGDYRSVVGLCSFNAGNGAVTLDLRPWMDIRSAGAYWTSNANLTDLIEELNKLLCAGQLSTTTKSLIQTFVSSTSNITYTDASPTIYQRRNRVRAIVELIATSPDYTIQK